MSKLKLQKALFILHEGIGSTIFNSQVLLHARSMKNLGIDFDILSYDTLKKTWELSNNNLKNIKEIDPDTNIILKKGMNIYYPFSTMYNLLLLISFLVKNRKHYSFIHARADYTAFLCIVSKPFHRLPVYWDCRGDAVSELKDSLSRKGFIMRLIGSVCLLPFERFSAFFNCRNCDGAIFVSHALFSIFRKKLKTKNYQVIPCPVSEKKFFFDSEIRRKMRFSLGISNDTNVYLYSGSMIAYQSLQEQYLQYQKLLSSSNNKIIIATSDPQIAVDFFKPLISDKLLIINVRFDEMNSYYNVADFAFLMRDKKQLNYVASPTKFGEYCLTGLPVVMNDTVEQAYENAKKLGNYISHNDMSRLKFPDFKRIEIAAEAKFYYSREILNFNYIKLYKSCPEI